MSKPISRRHILLPITFFWVFFGLASVQPFVVPYLREEFDMGEVLAVTVLASVYLILGLCRFITSSVIQHLGKKRTILLGVCGYLLFPVYYEQKNSVSLFSLNSPNSGPSAFSNIKFFTIRVQHIQFAFR